MKILYISYNEPFESFYAGQMFYILQALLSLHTSPCKNDWKVKKNSDQHQNLCC